MSISLYAASVGTFLQVMPAIAGLVDKAEAHCKARSLGDDALCGARLAPDMWDFAKQVMTTIQHSAGAVAALRSGTCGPDMSPAPQDFASLRKAVADAIAVLEAATPAEIDARDGGDVCFAYGDHRMEFTAADYVLTFALPNFYFHAAAAYAVLRNQGLQIGKMDFLGRPRLKG